MLDEWNVTWLLLSSDNNGLLRHFGGSVDRAPVTFRGLLLGVEGDANGKTKDEHESSKLKLILFCLFGTKFYLFSLNCIFVILLSIFLMSESSVIFFILFRVG